MKSLTSFLVSTLLSFTLQAQLKPYVQAFVTDAPVSSVEGALRSALTQQGIQVVGEYQPNTTIERRVLAITSDELVNPVKRFGGLRGFAAALRIGITRENGKTVVSYTNPSYWGNAYFQDDFPDVEQSYKSLEKKITNAMSSVGEFAPTYFGSEDGVEIDDLRDYQYMFGMPEFDDTVELGTFASFKEAKDHIDNAIINGTNGASLVYRIEIPGEELILYGIGLDEARGESDFMPIIDIGTPKHTAFLPYEMLVMGDEVHMLHGRFRIALSFPDLTMGTFSKIMSTPGNIEDMLQSLVEDR